MLEAQNGSILNGGASESDASINFNLLSPSLIFTIVHRLSVVTALSLKKKKKNPQKMHQEGLMVPEVLHLLKVN